MSEPLSKVTVSRNEAASLLGLSAVRVGQLWREGAIPAPTDGRFPLLELVRRYTTWLRDETRKSSQSAASTRVADARAQQIRLKIAREAGELIELQRVMRLHALILTSLTGELSGIGTQATRDLAIRAAVDNGIEGALTRCANKLAFAMTELRAGRDPLDRLTGGAAPGAGKPSPAPRPARRRPRARRAA